MLEKDENLSKLSNIEKAEKGVFFLLWTIMLFSFWLIFTSGFIELVNYAVTLFILFLGISSFYFIFFTNGSERKKLINMYTLYFSSILVTLTLLFNTSDNINKMKLDYWKVKISASDKIDINATEAFMKLEVLLLQYINQDKIEKITAENLKEIAEKNINESNTSMISIYENLFVTLVIIISEFMIIWFLVEFKIIRLTYKGFIKCKN